MCTVWKEEVLPFSQKLRVFAGELPLRGLNAGVPTLDAQREAQAETAS